MLDSTRTALPHAIHDRAFFSLTYLRFLLLSPQGRIGRAAYWGSLGVLLLGIVPLIILLVLLRIPDAVLGPVALTLDIVAVGMAVMVQVKRLHDRDRPWWLIVCNLIPLVNIWLMIELGFLPGTSGGNRFGPPPGLAAITPDQANARFEAGEVPPFAAPRDHSICAILHGLATKVFPDSASRQHRDIERLWLTALGLAYEGRPLDRLSSIPMPGVVHDIRIYVSLAPDDDLARMMAALAGDNPVAEFRLMLPDSLWESAA